MSDHLQADPKRAIAFLSWLTQGAPLHLERMNSVGPESPVQKTYGLQERESAEKFVGINNAGDLQRNIYFLPNGEFLSGGRGKRNLSAARFLHVDLDGKDYPGSRAEQLETILALLTDPKRMPKGLPAPTAICFSGGGYQAFWRLKEPMDCEAAKALNLAILRAYQGKGNTQSPAQLMRVPFTVNWLNQKKREAGREPALAFVGEPVGLDNPPVEYMATDFKLKIDTAKALAAPSRALATPEATDIQPLPLPVDLSEIIPPSPEWAAALVDGTDPPGKSYDSRSELVLACIIWLLGNDVDPGHVVSIITDPGLKISAHVLENPNPLRYAQRQVARGLAYIEARRGDWPKASLEGNPLKDHPDNVRYALMRLGVDARRNLFINADEITGQGLDDRDLNEIIEILSSKFLRDLHFKASPSAVKRELIAVAHDQAYHPVIDYLDGLAWDGTPRIDTWLRDYCGAEDSELNRAFGSKLLIAGVRRIKQPGVKFDTMLVLEGPQGAGKSGLAERLAVRKEWFCGNLDLKSDDKTKAELLARAWIVECQELDGMNHTTSQSLKKFLSTDTDNYRKAYGHDARGYRRHCIIIGTTNEDAYLRDLTGNRRFWPVKVGEIDLARLKEDVHQLWAEAVVRERAGEEIGLPRHLWQAAADVQTVRLVEDTFEPVLEDWFGERTGRVSLESVKLLLGFEGGRMRAPEAQRLRMIMDRIGWDYNTFRLHDPGQGGISPRKGFARGTDDERKAEWIARRGDGGMPTLERARAGSPDAEPPF
ncbi:VapE domain-containing protein [Martelella sp. FOR1707]